MQNQVYFMNTENKQNYEKVIFPVTISSYVPVIRL